MENIVLMLCGNKCDLESSRIISTKAGKKSADEKDALFIETSCLNNENVDKAFMVIIEAVCLQTFNENGHK